jgi:hypothetical protein
MFKKILFAGLMAIPFAGLAQEKKDDFGWKYGGVGSIVFNQASFTNWAAGGENNLMLTSLLSLNADFKDEKRVWENGLDLEYGKQRIQRDFFPARKSQDVIELNSKYGRKISPKTYASVNLNARTQFAKGYKFGDSTRTLVSDFLAPLFVTPSVGFDHKPFEGLSLYLSPLTGKFTYVGSQFLADKGAFGVEPGGNFRSELGASFNLKYKTTIMENVSFETKLQTFTNYSTIDKVDVNWENLISMKINEYLSANLITLLIYDEDIPVIVDEETGRAGPRVQFKEVFGVGLTYKF